MSVEGLEIASSLIKVLQGEERPIPLEQLLEKFEQVDTPRPRGLGALVPKRPNASRIKKVVAVLVESRVLAAYISDELGLEIKLRSPKKATAMLRKVAQLNKIREIID